MDWTALIEHRAVQGAFAGAAAAVRRDWRAFKMAPAPKDFNWRQFLISAVEGAVLGALAGAGLSGLV